MIDIEAKAALDAHLAELKAKGRLLAEVRASREAAERGHFVVPSMYEIGSLKELDREHFGPILHVIRWKSGELDKVIEAINATGYGLTLGLQSRIDTTRQYVEANARVGNLYVNRNQIGAVVESQPFGGEGLSGTGPKAGGPHYVAALRHRARDLHRHHRGRRQCVADGGDRRLIGALSRAETGQTGRWIIAPELVLIRLRGGLSRGHERISPKRPGPRLAASFIWRLRAARPDQGLSR